MIFPVGHERMEAQRLPYITIGIVALNVLIFLFTIITAPKTRQELENRAEELIQFYVSHPDLEMPQQALQKFPPEAQKILEELKNFSVEDSLPQDYSRTALMQHTLNVMAEGADQYLSEEQLEEIKQQEQEHFKQLVDAFEYTYKQDVYVKYGYLPARGGVFTLFSAMFMHGGFLHILFNMWFLWLSGCNIEDIWGRIVYPIFYLAGGIAATLAHGMMYPNSTEPLIGASGAIAAVMGAFMIRLYDVKINFVYFFWAGLRSWHGRFKAPAYFMLPLWLLQQVWEAFLYGGTAEVAFWAHIGGFVFGATIALLIKFSGIERKYIAPAIEKKTALLDEHLASGMTKLQEGDVDGAIQDLREAAQNNPDSPLIYSELSRAYFQKGNRKLAMRDFKRAIRAYIKQGDMDEAVTTYIEISTDFPDIMLDPPQQIKMATAIEQRASEGWRPLAAADLDGERKEYDMYTQAALAYRQLILHYQGVNKSLDFPEVKEALTHYANICAQHLHRAKDACQAYQLLLKSSQLSSEKKQELQAKIQQFRQTEAEQAKQREQAARARQTRGKAQETSPQSESKTAAPAPPPGKPDIPIRQRIKIIQETHGPAIYPVASVAPHTSLKVAPVPGGLDLKRLGKPPLLFRDIYLICIARIPGPERSKILVTDLFVGGQSRPERIPANHIPYGRFFSNASANFVEKFRQFILYVVSQIDSVYLDQETLTFLETRKMRSFPDQKSLEIYEKHLWQQLKGAARVQCEQCWSVYWVDGNKIPEAGAHTKCTRCGHPLHIQRKIHMDNPGQAIIPE